jgi:hypothetical protein
MMKTNKNYRPPMILQEVSVQIERDFLESLVDKALVTSPGQEVETIDFTLDDQGHSEFNHVWE